MKCRLCFSLLILSMLVSACTDKNGWVLTVTNTSQVDRGEELVEISLNDIGMTDAVCSLCVWEDGKEIQIPSQVTYDHKLIFPVSMGANEVKRFVVRMGQANIGKSYVSGRQYPEREDDIAWENDRVGFRVYGPPLQKRGEKAYGYDLFLKRTENLVLEEIYAKELDSLAWKQINSLKADGKMEEADSLIRTISYHVDHGVGMDCYAVGPTLGAGTAALLQPDSTIVYPYCYKDFEILDNGPLRFTVKLNFHPITVGSDTNVVETRWIQLDKGSHLNKTTICYSNLSKETKMVTGIVVHDSNPDKYGGNAAKGFMSYVDKTIEPDGDNGLIFIGTVVPDGYSNVEFKRMREPVNGVSGHWLGHVTYVPREEFTYYWGFGWNKFGFGSREDWNKFLEDFACKQRTPLKIEIKEKI